MVLCRLSSDGSSSYDSVYSGRDSEASSVSINPDLQAAVPQILQNLEAIHASQQHLLQLWHHKKMKLDQCFQLRLFEQDCEKVMFLFFFFKFVYSKILFVCSFAFCLFFLLYLQISFVVLLIKFIAINHFSYSPLTLFISLDS